MGQLRVVSASAPVRVCDTGGWTDTWFARHGAVFSIAVTPAVEVELAVRPRDGGPRVAVSLENYGERYDLDADGGRHPLVAAAIAAGGVPADVSLEVAVESGMPPGASTGTSAALVVALLAALDHVCGRRRGPGELAAAAHEVETVRLGRQAGIQDQIAAAWGGINFIEIPAYPTPVVTRLELRREVRWALQRRLLVVYLGRAHASSEVHEAVIAAHVGRPAGEPDGLEALRQAAVRSRDAVLAGDLEALGAAMRDNTDAQAALHPALVGPAARRLIELARQERAAGWKVNGAGGDGGSMTLLAGPRLSDRARLVRMLGVEPGIRVLPAALADHGVRVWESVIPV